MTDEPRRWWQKKRLMIPLGVVALLGVAGAIADEGAPERAVARTTTTQALRVTTTEAPTTTVAPEWREVARLEGSNNKRSELFEIPDDAVNARLRYSAGDGFFAVYLMEDGQTFAEDGGFPEVTCTDPCEDETRLVQRGTYYLDVNTSADYSVVVEVLA